jgi:hypothetical protein
MAYLTDLHARYGAAHTLRYGIFSHRLLPTRFGGQCPAWSGSSSRSRSSRQLLPLLLLLLLQLLLLLLVRVQLLHLLLKVPARRTLPVPPALRSLLRQTQMQQGLMQRHWLVARWSALLLLRQHMRQSS